MKLFVALLACVVGVMAFWMIRHPQVAAQPSGHSAPVAHASAPHAAASVPTAVVPENHKPAASAPSAVLLPTHSVATPAAKTHAPVEIPQVETQQSVINNLLKGCLSATAQSLAQNSNIAEPVGSNINALGVTNDQLLCPDGDYQTCLQACFDAVVCDDTCPCLNTCYSSCAIFISCGQWSNTDVTNAFVGIAKKADVEQGRSQ